MAKNTNNGGFTPHQKHEDTAIKVFFRKRQKNFFGAGFTLMETIIYIALATLVVGILFSYGWNLLLLRTKADVIRETTGSAQLVSERLKREIRAATDIDGENSKFNEVPGKIVFSTTEGNVTIESEADKISIKREGGEKEFIHSDAVRARDFLLARQVSGSGKTQYVGFSFTAESYFPEAENRKEYQFSIPWRTGVAIRK